MNLKINGKVDPQHLQDAFKNNQGQQQDQAGTDDDIKIIEYDKRDEEISDVRRKSQDPPLQKKIVKIQVSSIHR